MVNYEIYVEERYEDALRKVEQHRLEKEALSASPKPNTWFERRMLLIGNWLIAKGESMRKRYEAPACPPYFSESIKLAR
jgi:hypothetical protein